MNPVPMTSAATIAELEALLDGTSITTMTLKTAIETITLRRQASPNVGVAVAAMAAPRLFSAAAPSSGAFLHRHPLRDTTLVQLGQPVQAGTVLGLIQVGPLLLHVAAPRAGTVVAMLAPEDAVVGYGTPLVQLESAEA